MSHARAWAAGFFDGEGCVQVVTLKARRGIPYRKLQATIAQVDRRVLDRFRGASQVGKVYGPYKRASYTRGRYWLWNAVSYEKVQWLCIQLWPWLGPVKRRQFKQSLQTAARYHRAERRRRHAGR